jgi:AraC-like DNA-binding protein
VGGYATVVLVGSFIEASFAGRAEVGPGDVLLHGRFDCHANEALSQRGPQILRLPWWDDSLEGHFRVRDPDELAQIAERDPFEAALRLRDSLEPARHGERHWSEMLARALSESPELCLQGWAERAGLAPSTVSRGFHRRFGVTPRMFRLEVRARRAWAALTRSTASLTSIAHEFGFADLPHMSRSIASFTGSAPSWWRHHLARPPLPALHAR